MNKSAATAPARVHRPLYAIVGCYLQELSPVLRYCYFISLIYNRPSHRPANVSCVHSCFLAPSSSSRFLAGQDDEISSVNNELRLSPIPQPPPSQTPSACSERFFQTPFISSFYYVISISTRGRQITAIWVNYVAFECNVGLSQIFTLKENLWIFKYKRT